MLELLRSGGIPQRSEAITRASQQVKEMREDKGGLLSPWTFINNLAYEYRHKELKNETKTDIAIIGGGITGILTAYFILKTTNLSVTICEAGTLACGATANNAGHLTPTFEDTFHELQDAAESKTHEPEKKTRLAADAKNAALHGFSLYKDLIKEVPSLHSLFVPVLSYDALEKERVTESLGDLLEQYKNGVKFEKMLISDNLVSRRLSNYADVFYTIPQEQLRRLLKTKEYSFPAAIVSPAAILNGVDFCYKLGTYLSSQYGERFNLYEQTPVLKVDISEEKVELHTGNSILEAEKIVFCTNGHNQLQLNDSINPENNHLLDKPEINFGAMAGYLEEVPQGYLANAYFTSRRDRKSYPYVTESIIKIGEKQYKLVCVGGPTAASAKFHDSRDEAIKMMLVPITEFISDTYDSNLNLTDLEEPPFKWVGTMLYSEGGVRLIGKAQTNERLLFNTACNGIGLALAAYGAEKVALQISGRRLKPSLFDPQ